jgi:hypothetical protein
VDPLEAQSNDNDGHTGALAAPNATTAASRCRAPHREAWEWWQRTRHNAGGASIRIVGYLDTARDRESMETKAVSARLPFWSMQLGASGPVYAACGLRTGSKIRGAIFIESSCDPTRVLCFKSTAPSNGASWKFSWVDFIFEGGGLQRVAARPQDAESKALDAMSAGGGRWGRGIGLQELCHRTPDVESRGSGRSTTSSTTLPLSTPGGRRSAHYGHQDR